jgi:hypothetical protein
LEEIKARITSKFEQAKKDKSELDTIPVLKDMLLLNEGTIDAPYAGNAAVKVATRVTSPNKTANMDLLQQNRLDIAAPLAKQLGVNPTDRDFQASLDRIVDTSSSKASRAAQLNQLISKIERKQGVQSNPLEQEMRKRGLIK